MIWISIFSIVIAQGVFLISLIAIRGVKNPLATRFIIGLLVIMIFINFGYLVNRSGLSEYIPQFFALPFGMMLLFGPLLFFYSKSVIDVDFEWKPAYWIHFVPYAIQFIMNIQLLMASREQWAWFNEAFLAGTLPFRLQERIIFGLHSGQLLAYLFVTYRWIDGAKRTMGNAQYIISVSARIKWLKQLIVCFVIFLVTVVALYTFVMVSGFFMPVTNYIYTLVISVVVYFIAYKLVLNPELISPDFDRKYRAYMQFIGESGEKYLGRIRQLMDEDRVYLDQELNLSKFAQQVGLPSHQLSKLVNEKFEKSFNDFVNEYRVSEFIKRINDAKYSSYSIYGIALDVGFKSKSAFNVAFKKITGRKPSEYKNSKSGSIITI